MVQSIYNANYQFATPPPLPTLRALACDGSVPALWDDEAERGVDPVTNRNDFEGYRIYRSTDPTFLDPQVIVDGQGTGPIGNGRPIAQFDLENDVLGYSDLSVEGIQYYLGDDTGIVHSYRDSTVTNGQTYYYAVTSYDAGEPSFNFYPSENADHGLRTPRGGTILPSNVVQVRPNARVAGYVGGALREAPTQVAGVGRGVFDVRVLNPDLVPEDRAFRVDFLARRQRPRRRATR